MCLAAQNLLMHLTVTCYQLNFTDVPCKCVYCCKHVKMNLIVIINKQINNTESVSIAMVIFHWIFCVYKIQSVLSFVMN